MFETFLFVLLSARKLMLEFHSIPASQQDKEIYMYRLELSCPVPVIWKPEPGRTRVEKVQKVQYKESQENKKHKVSMRRAPNRCFLPPIPVFNSIWQDDSGNAECDGLPLQQNHTFGPPWEGGHSCVAWKTPESMEKAICSFTSLPPWTPRNFLHPPLLGTLSRYRPLRTVFTLYLAFCTYSFSVSLSSLSPLSLSFPLFLSFISLRK